MRCSLHLPLAIPIARLVRRAACVATLAVAGLWIAAPAGAQECAGDCDSDRQVAINELITCVNRALGADVTCDACDPDGDGSVGITELIVEVNNALAGCPDGERPDLVPISARFRSTTPSCINDTSEIMIALEVCVANRGPVASGAFLIQVVGEEFARIDGLASNAELCVEGAFFAFDIDVFVDADEEVAETDELNNFRTFFVPRPTQPPFCTATPTITPTGSPTDSPTITPTETETPLPTETTTPSETPTEADTPTATPTEPDTPTATPTEVTSTPTETATEVTATPTETAATPTETPATPTETAVDTATPTETAAAPSATPTETPADPTATVELPTATPTETPSAPSATPTDTPTAEPSPSPTPTESPAITP